MEWTFLGDDFNDLFEEYILLKNKSIRFCRIRGSGGEPTPTQVGIDKLKGDIEELKEHLKTSKGLYKSN